MMVHQKKLVRCPGTTRLHDLKQPSLFLISANVTSTVSGCLHCAKILVHLHKQANALEVFLPFESLKSVAIDSLGPFSNSRLCFQCIIVIADRFPKLVQQVQLGRIRSMDFAQAFSEQRIYMYGSSET